MTHDLRARAAAWIAADPDAADRAELTALLDAGDEAELARRFAAPLSFGTAGLRGPVMAGPAGMNRLTVRRATQGVVAWLGEIGVDPARGVVVGRDARRGSEAFNDEVVAVLLGAGVPVHEMPRPLPTPFVAFAVRALGAAAGVMITASHNPPMDNGYKLYAADGAQIIPPSDEIVERHSARAGTPVMGDRGGPRYHRLGEELLADYRDHVVARFGGPSDLVIAYTPLHGVGGAPVIELLAAAGFANVHVVESQFAPDAAFPTLPFPNPEEPGALDQALATADRVGADLVLANDPDADRLGAAVRDRGAWRPLRGDEIGWLLASSLLPGAGPDDVVATSLVSSTLLGAMARDAGVAYATTLTGFKWVARAAGAGVLRFGYEEALGFAVDPLVADKDGMSAALALARLADDLAREGRSLVDRLDEIEARFGVHAGAQVSVRAEGAAGLAAIAAVVARLRATPPTRLGGLDVTEVIDLSDGWHGLPATEGVWWRLGEAGRVVVRPSGTEPKLKAYLEVVEPADSALGEARVRARARLDAVRRDVESLTRL
ncbi:MAG: phospho-sugar mutase [Acidimicrobiales bacterium]